MSSSNKKERRRQRLRQADEEALARELARPRRVDEDFHARGIGFRRVQVFVLPSFDPVRSWDIRERRGEASGELALYYAEGPAGRDEMLSPGYRRLACPSNVLGRFVARLSAVRVCPVPPPLAYAGLDGTSFGVSIFGDLYSECRLRWWGDPPADWVEVNVVVQEMIATFTACPLADDLNLMA